MGTQSVLFFFNQLKLRKQYLGPQGPFSSRMWPLARTFPKEIMFLSLAQSPLGFSRSLQGILDKADNATSRSTTADHAQGVPHSLKPWPAPSMPMLGRPLAPCTTAGQPYKEPEGPFWGHDTHAKTGHFAISVILSRRLMRKSSALPLPHLPKARTSILSVKVSPFPRLARGGWVLDSHPP